MNELKKVTERNQKQKNMCQLSLISTQHLMMIIFYVASAPWADDRAIEGSTPHHPKGGRAPAPNAGVKTPAPFATAPEDSGDDYSSRGRNVRGFNAPPPAPQQQESSLSLSVCVCVCRVTLSCPLLTSLRFHQGEYFSLFVQGCVCVGTFSFPSLSLSLTLSIFVSA